MPTCLATPISSTLPMVCVTPPLARRQAAQGRGRRGAPDDQEPDNLFCLDALTPRELRDNLGYPRGNFWGIAHSQLLRLWSKMYTRTAGPVRTRVPPCHRAHGEFGGSYRGVR